MDGNGGDGMPQQPLVDTTDIFTTDEIFADREGALIWAKSVGRKNGIIIVTVRSDTATGKRGRKDKLIMGCERGGKYKSKLGDAQELTHEGTCSRLIKCPFKLRSRPLVTGEGWIVSVRCGTHNHPLADTLKGHRYLGRLTKKEREYVNEQTKYGLEPRFILSALKDKNKDNLTLPTQIYKARSSYRLNLRGGYTEMQHLLKLIHDEKYLYWVSRRKDSDILENIFWTHPDCVKLLNMFPSVLILDSTYKTNKYRLPLLEIVGSTSTELTFSVGFAYLEHEKKENFVWALKKLKELFNSPNLISKVFVTDRDLACMKAIEEVFPASLNLLCTFHIDKNVSGHMKKYIQKEKWESVMELWHKIMYSATVEEYNENLKIFEILCGEEITFVQYVIDTWLKDHKERFVAAWTNRLMHLGNTTTNRAESAHWRLKNMLQHSKGDLCKSWDGVNSMLKLQISTIKASFQSSVINIEHRNNTPFYGMLHGFVSRKCLEHVAEQFRRVTRYKVVSKELCGCTVRTTHGIPCACELAKYHQCAIPIPLNSIDAHWRKLSMEHELECEDVETLNDISGVWNDFNQYYKTLDVVHKRSFKTKLLELIAPFTISMCSPCDKVSTKGGVKRTTKKKSYDATRDPSFWEHVDASQGSSKQTSQRSSKQPSQRSSKQPSQISKNSNEDLRWYPTFVQSFIVDVIDVEPDGNCGYRAIGQALGWGEDSWPIVRMQLDKEIHLHADIYSKYFYDTVAEVRESLKTTSASVQGREKWMSMPCMGHVIATRYNCILVSLSQRLNNTFFPLHSTPPSLSSQIKVIAIGFVNNNHFVQLKLKPDCPLPPPSERWRENCTEVGRTWEMTYAARLMHWRQLNPTSVREARASVEEAVLLDED